VSKSVCHTKRVERSSTDIHQTCDRGIAQADVITYCFGRKSGKLTLCLKKGYHPTTNDNFNNSCPIPVIFGTIISEE